MVRGGVPGRAPPPVAAASRQEPGYCVATRTRVGDTKKGPQALS